MHRPDHHRGYAEQSCEDAVAWANSIGEGAKALVAVYMDSGGKPLIRDQQLRALRPVAQEFGPERFDKACARAVLIGAHTVKSLRSMLRTRMEEAPVFDSSPVENPPSQPHENVRGAGYFGGRP